MDGNDISTENQRYTANPSFAKTLEFSKTSATIFRVKVKIFRFFYSYSGRFYLG